jgi:CHAT domain-containing protein
MAKALEHYERALEISQRISDVKTQAQGLLNSARCLLKLGRLEESRERAKIALQIIESRRSNLASLGLRTSLTSGSQQYFRFYIDTLMQLEEQSPGKDYATIAFEAAERSRARTLLDRLTELRADIRQGVAPELREREKILQKNIRAKARSLGPRAQEQLPRLLAEYEDLQTRIRLSSPRYAALTQPQPVRLTTIQKQLLDPDTLVLEYLLGEERSYLWAVSNERLHAFILPGRSEIESLVRVFNDSLSRPPAAGTSAQGARPDLWRNQAAKVGRLLLAPVWSLLAGKRLLIVPDGILQYLSFPALIVCEPGQESRSRPLIFNHEIVQLTSVTVVNMLREGGGSEMRRVALHPEQPEGTRVAVFADPVYGRDDPRLQGVTHRAAHPAADSQAESLPSEPAWGNAAAAQHFGRLLFSRREGEAIIGLVPHGRARAAFGFEASRSAFADGSLKSFDYIHVASHAVVDDARPELSGIVLSLVDRQGQSQDGYVRLLEIFNLDLPANLVVLSSCRSSVGKEIGGEGMASLTRGFFHAGSSRVVASLWEINDMATSGLMTDFYAGMLGPRHLRQAQSSRWSHPHYWGAFAFHGDWH